MSLVVTGTIGIDTIEAPTGRAPNVLGGSCTYFSAAASFYGPVRLVAAVGDDFPPDHLATLAHFRSIDTAGLEVRKGSKTFRWTGRYQDNMDPATPWEGRRPRAVRATGLLLCRPRLRPWQDGLEPDRDAQGFVGQSPARLRRLPQLAHALAAAGCDQYVHGDN